MEEAEEEERAIAALVKAAGATHGAVAQAPLPLDVFVATLDPQQQEAGRAFAQAMHTWLQAQGLPTPQGVRGGPAAVAEVVEQKEGDAAAMEDVEQKEDPYATLLLDESFLAELVRMSPEKRAGACAAESAKRQQVEAPGA